MCSKRNEIDFGIIINVFMLSDMHPFLHSKFIVMKFIYYLPSCLKYLYDSQQLYTFHIYNTCTIFTARVSFFLPCMRIIIIIIKIFIINQMSVGMYIYIMN